ncbi:MAG: hypothetical protein GY822_00595 [Deltaproteobacteria bacterium]|nr:hypothetical protein [Deltaproteobacteria bacterium]
MEYILYGQLFGMRDGTPPEMERFKDQFSSVGINDAFIQKGKDLLADLEKERGESEALQVERIEVTKQVNDTELAISRLLSRLAAADEIVCLEDIEAEPVFRLHVIRTEKARADAENEARRIENKSRAFKVG